MRAENAEERGDGLAFGPTVRQLNLLVGMGMGNRLSRQHVRGEPTAPSKDGKTEKEGKQPEPLASGNL